MKNESFDFYSPSNFNLNDLESNLKNSLTVMNNLDDLTLKHCQNVSNLVTRICGYMKFNNKFTLHCMVAGYIHDVGKLFIPKEILFKNGPLTPEEFEVMKKHTTYGYEYCMNDPYLREFSDGPLYHHEFLNGTGYPQGLIKKDIPYSAQIITVADEYDALVTKRHYITHVHISEVLKTLIKNAEPPKTLIALDTLKQNQRLGKINGKPLKVLFTVVIDDILYEISCVVNYTSYLESQIKRLDTVNRYYESYLKSKKESTKQYYASGINMLLQNGETIKNYLQIQEEYKLALKVRKQRIKDLYEEIKVIKKLKVN